MRWTRSRPARRRRSASCRLLDGPTRRRAVGDIGALARCVPPSPAGGGGSVAAQGDHGGLAWSAEAPRGPGAAARGGGGGKPRPEPLAGMLDGQEQRALVGREGGPGRGGRP